jgi:hypothetical protein
MAMKLAMAMMMILGGQEDGDQQQVERGRKLLALG